MMILSNNENNGSTISGELDSIFNQTSASLLIDGPGITHYTYTVNNVEGVQTEEISLADNPIIKLSDLVDKQSYTVYVKGKKSAGAL